MRILLLDRSRLFAEALGRRLLTEDDVIGFGIASSGAEAMRMLGEETYTVVVATADLAREMRASPSGRRDARFAVPIVILADPATDEFAPELFKIGRIAGWVSRSRSSDDLLVAIRTMLDGDVRLPMEVLAQLAEHRNAVVSPQTARASVLAALTEREVEVLLLLEQGKGRYEIAAELHLSPNTVRTHVQRILRRLNVHSTLAALALLRAG